ncbi:MAG TPA: hypothetical protein VFI27_06660 [candidate division Zixibacteria bacterium]|nr:hypothetical protein [candidate division Zixibacteria bacterium]
MVPLIKTLSTGNGFIELSTCGSVAGEERRLILPRTLGIDTVSTWLGFELALVTNLMAQAVKIDLFSVLRYQRAKDAMVKLLRTLRFGTEHFVTQVDAHDFADGPRHTFSSTVSGDVDGRITGLVAAQGPEHLNAGIFPSGVFQIKQRIKPLPFNIELEAAGLQFHANSVAIEGTA